MKKIILFFKLYWLQVIITLIGLSLLLSGFLYTKYTLGNYLQLEDFTRRQISGMMAVYMPMMFFAQLLIIPLYFAMYFYMMRGGGMGNLGNEKAMAASANVKWSEVIGMKDAKREAMELVKLLKDRSMVKAIGGKIIKGTMMIGPPGCGKTYLAKAIATECGLPMLSAVGSEFVGIFIGVGSARMRTLFKQARAVASLNGGCVIFIDEVDSFARPRQADRGFGGTTDHNATVNQFLTELDGLRQAENNIVVIAATNVPEDELDPAIMRAGRFERKIHITLPNLEEREELFKFYLSRVNAEKSINPQLLARKALYFSPSDIDAMVRESGLIALRQARTNITGKDLSDAYDRVSFGLKSNITLTKEEKIWTAYHEAGHALIAYLEHPTNDVIKASIVPHKGNLGFISQRPVEEMHSANKDHLLANIKVSVASYVAEQMTFGKTSSGVGGGRGSDFDTAMRIAQMMVWRCGMGKSGLIGDFYAMTDAAGHPLISEKTKETLDEDVQHILQTCLKEVEQTLSRNKDLLEEFSQNLIKKEELEYDEIVAIFDKYGLKSASRSTPETKQINARP